MDMHRQTRSSAGSPPGAIAARGYPRALYDGWLKVERSMMDRMDAYHVENVVTFPGGWVAVQQCSFTRPIETVWGTSERSYVFDLSLDSRKATTTVEFMRPGGSAVPVEIGTMYMVPPGQRLLLRAKRGQARSMRCFLDAKLIEAHLPSRPVWFQGGCTPHDMARLGGGQIEWILRRIYRELHEPDFATPEMVESLTRQLAVEIVRRFKLRDLRSGHLMGGLAPWRLRLIRDRVETDAPMPDLTELAALCDMTVRHLSRAFRTETGQTVGKYLEAAMADRATSLLSAGASVREVSDKLGYATSSSFACAFRRATGLLPSEIKTLRAA